MNIKITLLFSLFVSLSFAQSGAPAAPYYNGFNWTQTGNTLKNSLATKITTTHTRFLDYGQAEKAIKFTDLDPADATNTNLLLLYGFSNTICAYVDESNFGTSFDDNDHRRRHKEADSGSQDCAWNREHTYARALGTPNLSGNEANADVHHLRACDVARNGMRDNDKFFDGSGSSFETGNLWYPGDEWKGDVARMMMYMYLRYPTQCLPTNVGTGATVATDTNMIQLFLKWNSEDPVSQYEDNRNTYLGSISNIYGQGNRNPFIDNPYLATVIWGGVAAENRWPSIFLSTENFDISSSTAIYPNPSSNKTIYITSTTTLQDIVIYNIGGQVVQEIKNPTAITSNTYMVSDLPTGFYLVKLNSENGSATKKVIIN